MIARLPGYAQGGPCLRCGSDRTEHEYPLWWCCLNCGLIYVDRERDPDLALPPEGDAP